MALNKNMFGKRRRVIVMTLALSQGQTMVLAITLFRMKLTSKGISPRLLNSLVSSMRGSRGLLLRILFPNFLLLNQIRHKNQNLNLNQRLDLDLSQSRNK